MSHRGLALEHDVTWRLRIEPGTETFDDLILGPQAQAPQLNAATSPFAIGRVTGSYQFVAAVDDFRQGVDLVVRGRDLLASTGRQIRIARLLGRETPASFAHHDLIMSAGAEAEQVRWRHRCERPSRRWMDARSGWPLPPANEIEAMISVV